MKWNENEIDFLLDNILSSPREAHSLFAKRFGHHRSYESVRKQMNRLRETIVKESGLSKVSEQPLLALEALDLDPIDFLSLDPALMKQNTLLFLHSVSELAKEYRPIITKGVKSNKKSLVVSISDVHFGKQTKPGFCAKVATDRLLSIPRKIKEILGSVLDDIDEVVIFLLGDIVEGEDIFDRQNATLEIPVILQSKIATLTLWKLCEAFSSLLGVPIRVETVPGNHGRMSKTSSKLSNWDNSIYQTLGILSSISDSDISVNVNMEEFNTVNIKDRSILINHDGVKHMGTPSMKIKAAGWILSKDISMVCHGHWHVAQMGSFCGRKTFGNGSVCGPDDLSERMASEEPPEQIFFVVEKGKRISGLNILSL